MEKETYIEAIKEAHEVVKCLEDVELQKIAFGVILKRLIGRVYARADALIQSPATPGDSTTQIKNKGLSDEEKGILFEVEDDGKTLKLKVQPIGKTVEDQRLMLVHSILLGYHLLLGEDNVKATIMSEAARYWNLWDTNLSKTIRTSRYIQVRGSGKGKVYSLKPGAVAKLTESIREMIYGK